MDKLANLVDKLNHILIVIIEALVYFARKYTPPTIANWLARIHSKLSQKRKNLENKISLFKDRVSVKSQEAYDVLKSYQYKEKIDNTKTNFIKTAKTMADKDYVKELAKDAWEQRKSIRNFLKKINPNTLGIVIILVSLSVLAGYKIYSTGKKIAIKSAQKEAKEILPEYAVRPSYYKAERKQTVVSEITMPVYFSLKGSGNRVLFDLTLRLSNRNLVKYINKHEFELKDYINSHVEPFPPQLPLTQEGKIIIKEKVQNEVNRFLKERKVEGELQAVYIHEIISG